MYICMYIYICIHIRVYLCIFISIYIRLQDIYKKEIHIHDYERILVSRGQVCAVAQDLGCTAALTLG